MAGNKEGSVIEGEGVELHDIEFEDRQLPPDSMPEPPSNQPVPKSSSSTVVTCNSATAPSTTSKRDLLDRDDDSDDSAKARGREITELARQVTRQSTKSHPGDTGKNPFLFEPGSYLDPSSPHFNARAYVRAVLDIQHQDPERFAPRFSGIAFKNLNAYGYGMATDYQKSVVNIFLGTLGWVRRMVGAEKPRRIDILRDLAGIVESGEMLVVLGPPGSGCSTFLKTIAGETHGYHVDPSSYINYQGISPERMHHDFRGEAIYTSEVDVHFPMLSVGDTLTFAARARAPQFIPGNVNRDVYANHTRDVVMAMFGIGHTVDTRVGDDYIRGVSGGERKRVTIAEAVLSGAPLQCWDNSTRGLDSANAIEFCKTLRTSADITGTTSAVSIYQAPQSAFDFFDKVIVLFEGRQIYFGCTTTAKAYFVNMGFECPDRQTTADFLTSMTSSRERVIRPGFEGRVPRTPDEFAQAWKNSSDYRTLIENIDAYDQKYALDGEYLENFKHSRKLQQGHGQRVKSPYTLTYLQQVKLCLWRGYQRLMGDPSLTISQIFGNFLISLILASLFYNQKENTGSFFARGALIFFAILMNAFGSALEILTLYAQRPIVEKHSRYAFYHPSCEAFASMLMDLPAKVGNAIIFNLTLYFMTNLRREPGPFFFFVLISFFLTLTMSMIFRSIAAMSRTLAQAMVPTALFILSIIIYTGFAIPTKYMLGWSRWINYLNPVAFGFEALMINEFHSRDFPCSSLVPSGEGYEKVSSIQQTCSSVGSVPGSSSVNGDRFINSSYGYYHANKWRNFGIIIAFMTFFMLVYLLATEWISAKKSRGEVLVFRREHLSKTKQKGGSDDIEIQSSNPTVIGTDNGLDATIVRQKSIFHWQDVCYDIKIKGQPRRILDHVDGWVKPGTLTALMGVSGAGKTTLLDCLATRVTTGVITGEMLVDGHQRDASFQRKTGYVQQQDLHLSTSTVREALNFSALLRQPADISTEEKLEYVDQVIKLLDMEEFADAVVGAPAEGLNVEQRKRLTIGVELAAKPQLLLFLDEPTSGLDSQTSWAICDLMERLKMLGQAILCTIHQPSAMLFQRFDRLLFLAKGGKTIYFGDIGKDSHVLRAYFEKNGAPKCPSNANPAEWILEVIGATPGTTTDVDWHQVWRNSPELLAVQQELAGMKKNAIGDAPSTPNTEASQYREFAASFSVQLWQVTVRVFQQYWRSPSFIHSKLSLCLLSGLFVGFSFFKAKNTQQGLQNQMFAMFMLLTIFGQLVEQSMPHFVTQRALYEVRERPSKAYSWKAFMLANIAVDIPWSVLMAILLFFPWYYSVGLYQNATVTDSVTEKGALMFLFILAFLLFTSTFSTMVIAGMDSAETGGNLANLMFSLCLIFCGVLVRPQAMPGFWIFMYRVSPFTYLVSGMLSTAVSGAAVVCAANEYLTFESPANITCGEYMGKFMSRGGTGYLLDPKAVGSCKFCTYDTADFFLKNVNAPFSEAWRNFGLMWVYIVFNVFGALFLYWLLRVPKNKKKEE